IDTDRTLDAMDRSYPAFWLPFQDVTAHNHSAQWVATVATPPKSGADAGSGSDSGVAGDGGSAGDGGGSGSCVPAGGTCGPGAGLCCSDVVCCPGAPFSCQP